MRMTNASEGFCSIEGCKLKALPGKDTCADHLTGEAAVPNSVPTLPVAKKPTPKIKDTSEDDAYETYNPVVEASKIARRMIAEEEAERVRFWQEQADRSPGQRMKKRPPLKMSARRPRTDMTGIKPELIKPGHSYRWVREVDQYGNPSDARVEQMKQFDYDVILDTEGNPLRSIFGVAMQAPVSCAAERIAVNMPNGALDRNALLADTQSMVDETNKRSRSGYAVGLVKDKEHGRYRDED